jgi:hypothetical protein
MNGIFKNEFWLALASCSYPVDPVNPVNPIKENQSSGNGFEPSGHRQGSKLSDFSKILSNCTLKEVGR